MSKKSYRLGSYGEDLKHYPTILRRKRKADCDKEDSFSCYTFENSSENTLSDTTVMEVCDENSGLTEATAHLSGPSTFSQFRGLASLTPSSSRTDRESPLPNFNWADPRDVWDLMVHKDAAYPRSHAMLARHPELQPRMRSILLDWLIEVCEVYKLHRETFYLAQDFIDRYLGMKTNVPKTQLQLIGITALFIASKMEEIYPPKLAEFAYVTDGACTESEILDKELIILKTLNWDLTPVTINSWLSIYLQLAANYESKKEAFLLPEFSTHVFAQVAQLLDLCILDVDCLQFSYSVIAAAALYYKASRKIILAISGLQWNDLLQCVKWMEPFAQTVKENGGAQLKFFNKIDKDDLHNIQIHNTDLKLLEKAQSVQICSTPVRTNCDYLDIKNEVQVLTPPHSSKKPCVE